MSNFHHCFTCDSLLWRDDKHVCPPAWECWSDDDEDLRTIYAGDEEDAAKEYAEAVDDDDPGTATEERTVHVRRLGSLDSAVEL